MKPTNPFRSNVIRGGLVAASFAFADNLQAAAISVNIVEATVNNDAQRIDTDETFGLGTVFGINTTLGNWTNTSSISASNLKLSTGANSTVGFSSSQPNGSATFNSAYDDTPLKSGFDDYTTTNNQVTVQFDNLNANFADGYFAIVYLTGFNANTGASITDGTTTFYYQTLNPPTAPVSFVQTTQTSNLGAGNNPFAQYAIFGSSDSPLTADSITFIIDTLDGGGAGIGGIQIVAVPESSAALLGGLGLLALLRRRR